MKKPYTTLTDSELITLLKEGDRMAFNQLYDKHSKTLFQYAFNILKDENECKDAIQDIFIWLWQNREKIEVVNLKGYLLAAVKYKLVRVIHNSKRRAEILAANPDFKESFEDDSVEVKDLQNIIKQVVDTLPPRAKQIFELSRNEYLSNKEIAEKMNISVKTVENQMTIALRKIKNNLGRMSFWVIFL